MWRVFPDTVYKNARRSLCDYTMSTKKQANYFLAYIQTAEKRCTCSHNKQDFESTTQQGLGKLFFYTAFV